MTQSRSERHIEVCGDEHAHTLHPREGRERRDAAAIVHAEEYGGEKDAESLKLLHGPEENLTDSGSHRRGEVGKNPGQWRGASQQARKGGGEGLAGRQRILPEG